MKHGVPGLLSITLRDAKRSGQVSFGQAAVVCPSLSSREQSHRDDACHCSMEACSSIGAISTVMRDSHFDRSSYLAPSANSSHVIGGCFADDASSRKNASSAIWVWPAMRSFPKPYRSLVSVDPVSSAILRIEFERVVGSRSIGNGILIASNDNGLEAVYLVFR